MKTILTALFLIIMVKSVSAQNVAINSSGAPADASAMLDISSTGKGILVPRMMPWERTNIQNPANGLLVYDLVSNSFWYYSNGWQEIGSGGSMSGPAGGDLSGDYPTPTVSKLQNLDVDFGVPFDKQVLKWDALDNNWKGRNDSLFLPYNAASSNASSLFGITNNSSSPGASAIFGKRGAGTGLAPAATIGVWGDNANSLGVLGSSNTGVGVYGLSLSNHGVYGYSTTADFAGVKGTHANDNGIGVMGEIGQIGIGVYGKGTGNTSVAGKFENTSLDNTSMALDVRNLGLGVAGSFFTNNTDNASATLLVNTHSSGHGIFALHDSVGDNNAAIWALHVGSGQGIYARSHKGIAAKMIIDNTANASEVIFASTLGKGKAGMFIKNNTTGSISDMNEPAVLIDNNSLGNALKVTSLYAPSVSHGVDVNYAGEGYGVNISSTKRGLHVFTTDANGTGILSENYAGGLAIKAVSNAAVKAAILAQNSNYSGIGIKAEVTGSEAVAVMGVSNTGSSHGAIEGINSGGGSGVRGINTSSFGFGVIGESGEQHGIAGKFISSNPVSEVSPAIWAQVLSLSNGVDITLSNAQNGNTALYVKHDGTGNFALFRNTNYDEVTLANNGDFTTFGTVKVRNNKGIVRNSTSAQKRMETLSVQLVYFNMPEDGYTTETVTFAQAFSAAPVVTLGNINAGFTGPCDKMTVQIKNVTTTGCTVTMYNPGVSGNPDVSGTWNLLAIGNE